MRPNLTAERLKMLEEFHGVQHRGHRGNAASSCTTLSRDELTLHRKQYCQYYECNGNYGSGNFTSVLN